MVLCLLSGLASFALLVFVFGRAESLARLAERAATRLELGRAVPTLWGLAAIIFLLAASVVLFSTKVLALLGLLLLTVGLAVISLGLGVAALALGQRLLDALGTLETETLPALRLGLWTLFLASFLPFLGWLLVLLCIASGVGALLEILTARRNAES